MAGGVAGRREDDDAAVAEQVELGVEFADGFHVFEVERVVEAGGLGVRPVRREPFARMHDQRRVREEPVAAAMVVVQMRIHDIADVGRRDAQARELAGDVGALREIDLPILGCGAEQFGLALADLDVQAGVEQDFALLVHDEIGGDGNGERARLAFEKAAARAGDVAAGEGEELRGHVSLRPGRRGLRPRSISAAAPGARRRRARNRDKAARRIVRGRIKVR